MHFRSVLLTFLSWFLSAEIVYDPLMYIYKFENESIKVWKWVNHSINFYPFLRSNSHIIEFLATDNLLWAKRKLTFALSLSFSTKIRSDKIRTCWKNTKLAFKKCVSILGKKVRTPIQHFHSCKSKIWNVFCPVILLHFRMVAEISKIYCFLYLDAEFKIQGRLGRVKVIYTKSYKNSYESSAMSVVKSWLS